MLLSLAQLYKNHLLYINGIKRLEQSLLHNSNKEHIKTTLVALKKYYVMDANVKHQIEMLKRSPVKRWMLRHIMKRR